MSTRRPTTLSRLTTVATSSLSTPCVGPTAPLLADRGVLNVGTPDNESPLASAELFQ